MKYIFSRRQTNYLSKANVDMWVYSDKNVCSRANILYQEVNGVHDQEFLHKKSFLLKQSFTIVAK